MAIPDRAGWRIIHGHQQESPNSTAAFLDNLDERLARAFRLTSADIEDMGHPVATLAEWLIQKSTPQTDVSQENISINLIPQERILHVPYGLGVEYIFDVATYTTRAGIGYYIFGYYKNPGERLDERKRFLINRIGRIHQAEEWSDEYVNASRTANSEFALIAGNWATAFQHFCVTVREGENLDPQGGYPMAFRRAA